MALKSNKINIEEVESTISDNFSEKATSHETRDLIFTAIEVSKRTRVPMLFVGNPGAGKTKTIEIYGRTNGYHVEVLVGSQYARDDILGCPVNNNKGYMEALVPEWFYRIQKYDRPHYEVKDSRDFELVTDETIAEWKKEAEYYKNLAETTDDPNAAKIALEEVENLEAKLNNLVYVKHRDTVLFLDDISATPPEVGGALLQVCCDRTVRSSHKLPEGCILLSAANYSQNLPSFFSILSPTINRFCVINVLEGSPSSDFYGNALSMINEISIFDDKREENLPQFVTDYSISGQALREFEEAVKNKFRILFKKYSNRGDSSLGVLDIRNSNLDGLYCRGDNITEMYNFISRRSTTNYILVLKALCEMGVKFNSEIVHKFADGLLGIGTNSFDNNDDIGFAKQLKKFHDTIYMDASNILLTFSAESNNTPKKEAASAPKRRVLNRFNNDTISGKVKSIVSDLDTLSILDNPFFDDVITEIGNKFNVDSVPDSIKNNYDNNTTQFRSDFEAIQLIQDVIAKSGSMELEVYNAALKDIIKKFESYYDMSGASITKDMLA